MPFCNPTTSRSSVGDLYAYVQNDPLNLTDPSGLRGQIADAARWGLLGAAIGGVCAVAEPCGVGVAVGTAIGAAAVAVATGAIILNNQNQNEQAQQSQTPSLPDSLIGQNARPGGSRINTDLPGTNPTPEELFNSLGGGQSVTLPDGTKVAPNGVRLRPDTGYGPRIDIPANGSKPHETIHFPGSGP